MAYVITYTDRKTGKRGTMGVVFYKKTEAQKVIDTLNSVGNKYLKSKNHRIKKI